MQLKLRRTQRTGGIVTDKVFFQLDARVELTGQEQADIKKYKLGKTVIYNSEASKKHIEAGVSAGMSGNAAGMAKAAFRFAMARLNLNISIDDLCYGKHIECKDLDELLGAEEAIMTACENLRMYLDTAATFDGREMLVDFKTGADAAVVSAPNPVTALMPALAPPAAPMIASAVLPAPPPEPQASVLQATAAAPLSSVATAQAEPVSIDFGETYARFQSWWRSLAPMQRFALIGGTVVVVLFLLSR